MLFKRILLVAKFFEKNQQHLYKNNTITNTKTSAILHTNKNKKSQGTQECHLTTTLINSQLAQGQRKKNAKRKVREPKITRIGLNGQQWMTRISDN